MTAQPNGLGNRNDTKTRAEGPAENAACGFIAILDDQDLIDDFPDELPVRKLSLKGQLLTRLIREVVAGIHQPTAEEISQLITNQPLKRSMLWHQNPGGSIECLINPATRTQRAEVGKYFGMAQPLMIKENQLD